MTNTEKSPDGLEIDCGLRHVARIRELEQARADLGRHISDTEQVLRAVIKCLRARANAKFAQGFSEEEFQAVKYAATLLGEL